jgi:hypothetical protein
MNPRTHEPVPGNKIPAADLDPIALRILDVVPLPNSEDGLLRYQRADKQTDNQYIMRVDHLFSTKHQISGRYFYDQLEIPTIVDPKNVFDRCRVSPVAESKRRSELHMDGLAVAADDLEPEL